MDESKMKDKMVETMKKMLKDLNELRIKAEAVKNLTSELHSEAEIKIYQLQEYALLIESIVEGGESCTKKDDDLSSVKEEDEQDFSFDDSEKADITFQSYIPHTTTDVKIEINETKQNMFSCGKCDEQFNSVTELEEHLKSEDHLEVDGDEKITVKKKVGKDGTKFPCHICEKKFAHKSSLQKHIFLHTGSRPFKCDKCDKSFTRKEHLAEHAVTHTTYRPYACDECGNLFKSEKVLKSHKRLHSGEVVPKKPEEKERTFFCDLCGKAFAQKGTLMTHMRVHTGEKPYTCKVCGDSFGSKTTRKEHQMIHTGEKPYPCKVCGKPFRFRSALVTHMSVHTGKKPFSCEFCGKTFSRKQHMKDHKLTHSGDVAFRCEECGETFRSPTTFRKHKAVHAAAITGSSNNIVVQNTNTNGETLDEHKDKFLI